MARDTGVSELAGELAPLHPRGNTFPARSSFRSPRTRWSGVGPAALTRWPWKGCRSGSCRSAPSTGGKTRSFSSLSWRRRRCRGEREPDLLGEVAWWQTDDFWQYALFAAVAYIRATAEQAGVPVSQVCRQLGEQTGN